MATDFSKPITTDTYTAILQVIRDNQDGLAKMFDGVAAANLPDGAIRWNGGQSRFEIWDATGQAWGALASKYGIDVDQVDGFHAGNSSGQVAVSNGTKNTNLNADLLDGFHAGNSSGQVAVSNGSKNANFNADLLDGKHASEIQEFVSGTRMLFSQASAPAGWTQDVARNDRVLRVVSGNGDGTGGGWTISGLSVANHALSVSELPSHTHGDGTLSTDTVGNHDHGNGSLTAASNGAHSHSFDTVSGTGQPGNGAHAQETDGVTTTSTMSTASAGSHTHNITGTTGNAGSHNHDVQGSTGSTGSGFGHSHGINHNGNWRPAYLDVIVCTKD